MLDQEGMLIKHLLLINAYQIYTLIINGYSEEMGDN